MQTVPLSAKLVEFVRAETAGRSADSGVKRQIRYPPLEWGFEGQFALLFQKLKG